MKILVTGHAGMNGSWTCRELVSRGHEVVGGDTRTGLDWEQQLGSSFSSVHLDITDAAQVDAVIAEVRPDVIAHSAAITNPEDNPVLGMQVNAMGSVNLLEAAARHGVTRFVYSSSKAVYGEIAGEHGHPEYRPVDEEHVRAPITQLRVYAATKYLIEEVGRRYAESRGLDFVALRFATIYGPGKAGPVGVISKLIEGALDGTPVEIPKGRDQKDDFIYVKDVANGTADACEAGPLTEWAFNIGSGRAETLQDIADAVALCLPTPPEVSIGPGLDYLGINGLYSVLDPSRAKAQLGFEPEYDLKAGIADYVETVRQARSS